MEGDTLGPGLDEGAEKSGRVAVSTAARIVCVIRDDQRLVAALKNLSHTTA